MLPNVHLCTGFEFELVPARCIMTLTIVLLINSIIEKQQGSILILYKGGYNYIINKELHDKSLMNEVRGRKLACMSYVKLDLNCI